MTAPGFDAADQEIILAHFRRPHGKGMLATPDARGTASNPLCGESVTVTVALDRTAAEPRITDIRFSSDGCSISQASASMMTDLVRGEPLSVVRAQAEALRTLLGGERSEEVIRAVGPLHVLGGVSRLPARIACARLPWEALAAALAAAANGE